MDESDAITDYEEYSKINDDLTFKEWLIKYRVNEKLEDWFPRHCTVCGKTYC